MVRWRAELAKPMSRFFKLLIFFFSFFFIVAFAVVGWGGGLNGQSLTQCSWLRLNILISSQMLQSMHLFYNLGDDDSCALPVDLFVAVMHLHQI